MNKEELQKASAAAGAAIVARVGREAEVGIVLGTGWGSALEFEDSVEFPFGDVSPAFRGLADIPGHARSVVSARLGGVPVLALRGRVHLNESPADPALPDLVRLQAAMLIEAGVKTLVVTNAAGSLTPDLKVGEVLAIDGFVSVFAPPMPLFAGEFVSPDDAIDQSAIGRLVAGQDGLGLPFRIRTGGYVMIRGPFFEGRKYDKAILAAAGAKAVGMSTLPEACVAALYPGVRVLPLSFITNSAFEDHSHESNVRRAKESAAGLGRLLAEAVRLVSVP